MTPMTVPFSAIAVDSLFWKIGPSYPNKEISVIRTRKEELVLKK